MKSAHFTLSLQLIQAHFVAFNLNPEQGRAIIKALDLRLDDYKVAQVKMELADILLFEEKFNQALIYYSQIEMDLKNDVVAHEAKKLLKRVILKLILCGH
jgi:hypothetical protein